MQGKMVELDKLGVDLVLDKMVQLGRMSEVDLVLDKMVQLGRMSEVGLVLDMLFEPGMMVVGLVLDKMVEPGMGLMLGKTVLLVNLEFLVDLKIIQNG